MPDVVDIPDRLLITGPNGGGVAMVSRSKCETLFGENSTGLSISGAQAGWVVQDKSANSVRILCEGQLTTVRLSDDPMDLHDILFEGGRLWAVATELNAVLCLEQEKEVGRWAFSPEPDSWHVNCLAHHGGNMLASAFGRFDTTRGYKGNTRGRGEVFDVKSGETLIGGLSQPHSLVSEDGLLWLCDSETGEVHAYESGKCVRRLQVPGYARGLAIGRDHIYVGISRSRNEPASKNEDRFNSANVVVLDRSSAEVLGYLAAPWDEIYDIRILKSARLAEDLLLAGFAQHQLRTDQQQRVALVNLIQTVNEQHNGVIHAISEDIYHMQRMVTASLERAASNEGKAAIAEQLAGPMDLLSAGQANLEVAISPLTILAETLPVSLSGVHARIELLATEQKEAFAGLGNVDGMVAQLIQATHCTEAAIAEQLAGTIDLISAGQANLEVAISPLATLAETLPVSLSGVHARIELLATEQKEAFAGLGNVDGMVAQLVQATHSAEATEARSGDMHKQLERQLERIAGTPGMQDRIESAIAERTRMQIDVQTLAARIEKLETDLAESNDAIQALAGDLDQNRRGREAAQRQLEERSHELAVLRHEAARLRETSAQHETVINSLSWRLTRPLRFARRVLSGRPGPSDSDRLRGVWRKALLRLPVGTRLRSRLIGLTLVNEGGTIAALPDHHVAAVVELAPIPAGLPDVFVWSVIDFHFRVQRPQHLARALAAKGHRVFYISVNFCDSDDAGFHFDPLDGCGRLYQIHLYLAGEPLIYSQMPAPEQVAALHASLAKLLGWTRTRSSISLVQHPYWSALVRSVPNARVVYDCMDYHAGFDNNSPAVLEAEHHLVEESELVIVTSAWLEQEVRGARTAAVIRNAGEFEFFQNPPAEVFSDERGRRVIGYYGAIASWFDFDLVRRAAQAHPEALVVLVGHDSVGVAAALADLENILLVGEVAYTRLPYWLHAFDVCLLPFKVIPLTLATNPVKVYEYLSAGKSIVAVNLPEMAQFDGLIRTAADSDAFVTAVSDALATPASAELVACRQAFASRQTWAHRAAELDAVLDDLQEPSISVVVLTYNNLAFTQACLQSVEAHSDYHNLEVIVVDNASSDGSADFLRGWAAEPSAAGHARRLILNQDNLGFAAGNNVGLAAATGDVLVMLNNDTFVTPGWVRTLHSHLKRDTQLGLVGPVTNNIGNEARIEICYADMNQMVEQSGNYTRRHPGQVISIHTVAFFCAMLPRAVYDSLGGLDEAFGLGFFEDDDYCRRAQQAGWKIGCAEDVFIHHHLSASFNLVGAERKKDLFDRNKAIYEAKWGEWKPHAYRPATEVK